MLFLYFSGILLTQRSEHTLRLFDLVWQAVLGMTDNQVRSSPLPTEHTECNELQAAHRKLCGTFFFFVMLLLLKS